FRYLALRYHPDNQATGDRSQFDAILEAHNTLKDEGRRAKYHEDNQPHLPPLHPDQKDAFDAKGSETGAGVDREIFINSVEIDEDVEIQNSLLTLLYLKRRRNINEPGIGNAELELLSGCPPEHMDFHLWYLKSKGWISPGEDGLLAI